jgi:peptide/nickel transport system permease protein
MRFVARRLGFFLLTLWVALTLNFLLPRMMPGNPALAVLGKFKGGVSPQALKALEAEFGIGSHQSLLSQYVTYLGDVATGKFGVSLTTQPGNSVGRIVLDAIPWTLGLVGVTTILAFILGTGIGIIGAWRRGGRLDSIMPPIFVIMTVIPYFWIGLVLILVFGVKLHWLPYFFSYNYTLTPGLNGAFISNVAEHAILPAFTLLITTIGTWILTMRNTMITTLAEDYVRMARAKGLPGRRIMLDYAARNAILPNLTGFAMSLGFVVGGAILIEEVFNYQGVGYLLLQAVNNDDYPLMQALFLLITVAVLVAILISDIATAVLDPRTRGAG